jgi:hypothetical protein
MYLEASLKADAVDTGICDAVHNVEAKVGTGSQGHRESFRVPGISAGICSTAETRL